MLSGAKKKILNVFFEKPLERYHLREIARRAEIPVNSAHKYLHQFVASGLLIATRQDPKTFFAINPRNEALLKIFEYFEVEKKIKFFKDNPDFNHLKEMTQSIVGVMEKPALVSYDQRRDDIFLVAPYDQDNLPQTEVIKTLSLAEFRLKLQQATYFDSFYHNWIVLHNESLLWQELGKLAVNQQVA